MNTELDMSIQTEQSSLHQIAYQFRAMNTDIEMLIYSEQVKQAEQACHQVETIFAAAEDILSRFRQTSELNKLNRSGQLDEVSALLYESVAAAREMAELTNGIFDPTILDALEAAGYDRSFEQIAQTGSKAVLTLPKRVIMSRNWKQIELNPPRRSIKLPYGTRLDLGGIAKGATVDRAVRFLRQQGFQNFMVSAGGDMWLNGNPPLDAQGWTVALQNPLTETPELLTTTVTSNRAVATSATTGRHWWVNGQVRHHLIDPRTGEPTHNGLASVTALATSVQLADVMAKTALILGSEAGHTILNQIEGLVSLIFVTLEGEVIKL